MAAAATAGAAPPSRGLSDEIAIWEILVRLPPRSLLRCRAVCRAWRCATSTCDFLLAHHARQPTLPILCDSKLLDKKGYSLDIIPFDHRAAADQFQSVARFGGTSYGLVACCDGLFVLAVNRIFLAIYNPATRQYAPLWMLSGYRILGMYPHPATGEYRLLMDPRRKWQYGIEPKGHVGCYVLSLGSGQPPRPIEYADVNEPSNSRSVLLRGCLHWYQTDHWIKSSTIIVFDTAAESFRQMGAPVVSGWGDLFEMDGMLGISSFNRATTNIDIWVLQDYESNLWTFKWQIELPVMDIKARCEIHDDDNFWHVVVVPGDSELLVLVKFKEWLIQVDMDGKLVATFHRKDVIPTQFRLKQTLVQHTFFPTLEGYFVNETGFSTHGHLKTV